MNESAAGAAVSGSAPQTWISGLSALIAAADARDEPPSPDAGNDRNRVGRVFQNLQSHGRVTGDEIVIVERMHERSFNAGKRMLVERLPGDLVRHCNEFGAERPHPFDLRDRRCFDGHDRTGHSSFSRRVGNALSCVARANRPDAAFALGLRQHRYRIGGAAQFVGVDRLEVLQLEANIRVAWPEFQADQGRAQNSPRDALARCPDLGEFNGADWFQRRHCWFLSGELRDETYIIRIPLPRTESIPGPSPTAQSALSVSNAPPFAAAGP